MMRIHEIAKLLRIDGHEDVDSRSVLRFCRGRGIAVKSASSRIDEPVLRDVIIDLMANGQR